MPDEQDPQPQTSIPQAVADLVTQFEDQREQYRSGTYNEAQIRKEFIDPLFQSLGWDMANSQGLSPVYREVIHEDSLRIDGAIKAPDYCFRIGSARKFFVEAKKPSININSDAQSAYQIRRYAWNAKLPVSILTDFEEFAIYDCRTKPELTDSSRVGRIAYFTFEQYKEQWSEISALFSRSAILSGSIERYADKSRKPRGTQEVDDVFLGEIEHWRDILARDIHTNNPFLTVRELNYAVQMTIDRIVFLRIAEDRQMEPFGQLASLKEKTNIYHSLVTLFRHADRLYNSGLFHFDEKGPFKESADTLTASIQVGNAVIRKIIDQLYFPKSPYEFRIMPADILGQVYERFLGNTIEIHGKRIEIVEKPEVRKAGGVYYTPTFVVSNIVGRTLGPILENSTTTAVSGQDGRRRDRAPLRLLDPACGSGSFLIEAYQHLLDWYRESYVKAGPEGHARGKTPKLYRAATDEWRLTISERKRILLTHIFGVDIDPQAVEVTKLSLLLKVLEGASRDEVARQLDFFHTRALPDLSDNVKCGNSIIGPDIYNDRQLELIDDEERYQINCFDWYSEFSDVFSTGGFDIVIGNPPYLYSAGQKYANYLLPRFSWAQYQTDFYVYFVEKGMELLKDGGVLSFIVPDSWLNADNFSQMREGLLVSGNLREVTTFDFQVFKKASIENVSFIVEKSGETSVVDVYKFLDRARSYKCNELSIKDIRRLNIIDPRYNKLDEDIIKRMDVHEPLSRRFQVNRGLHAYRTDGFGISKFGKGTQTKRDKDERSYHADKKLDATYLPEVRGQDVNWFSYRTSGSFISYGDWLAEPRDPKFMMSKKFVLRKVLGPVLSGAIIDDPAAIDQSLYIILCPEPSVEEDELNFISGILLSRIGAWFLRTKYAIYDRLYPWYTKGQLAAFPVPPFDASVCSLVIRLRAKIANVGVSRAEHDQRVASREIEALREQLNKAVYRLYGLTAGEIGRIDQAHARPTHGVDMDSRTVDV